MILLIKLFILKIFLIQSYSAINLNRTLPPQDSNCGKAAKKVEWKSFNDPFSTNNDTYSHNETNSQHIKPRIVNGEEAVPNSWPWQVLLILENDGKYYSFCSGSLIYEEYVLTAAHCCSSANVDNIGVVLGVHDKRTIKFESIRSVSKMIIHENYNADTILNDICLLKLTLNAKLSDTVNTICLPFTPRDYILDKRVAITGWLTKQKISIFRKK
jgi:hypothetical protein